MSKVGIFCKASYSQGMGHLIRQSYIAESLKARGAKITFFIPDYPPAKTWLDQREFTRKILKAPISFTEIETASLDIIVLDIQNTTESFIKNIQHSNTFVISFEDLGEGRNHVDLLIDSNLTPEISPKLSGLFGYPYSVIAPEFETFHAKKREFKQPLESVLISLGGTDPHSMTSVLAKSLLLNKPDLSLTLLAGPGCGNIPALKDLQSNKVKLLESTSQMAKTLFDHGAVFCAGGVTLDEAMAVGTPAFVINQAAHQVVKTTRAEKQGSAINLGLAESWDKSRLEEILKLSSEKLKKMSQAGKSLIDGKGLNRVVDAIEAKINHSK
jgi:spore coat polysaccharide biosynthesis predicted glycosyltransferase SpsG